MGGEISFTNSSASASSSEGACWRLHLPTSEGSARRTSAAFCRYSRGAELDQQARAQLSLLGRQIHWPTNSKPKRRPKRDETIDGSSWRGGHDNKRVPAAELTARQSTWQRAELERELIELPPVCVATAAAAAAAAADVVHNRNGRSSMTLSSWPVCVSVSIMVDSTWPGQRLLSVIARTSKLRKVAGSFDHY